MAAALVAPASASAASTRYASPEGSGTACTLNAPCLIQTAINSAAQGDDVILSGNAGTYGTAAAPLTKQLLPPGLNVTIQGAPDEPVPVIYENAQSSGASTTGIFLSDGDVLRRVDIEGETGYAAPVTADGGSSNPVLIDHVTIHASGPSQPACELYAAAMVNSVCIASSQSAVWENLGFGAPIGTLSVAIRNSTLVSGNGNGIEVIPNSTVSLNVGVTNSIVRGGSGSADVKTFTTTGGSATVTLDHSNYATADTTNGGTVTAPGSGTNQTAAPQFVNAASLDFREAPGSPTIDHGINSVYNGTDDLANEPRIIGAATDIGAYEFVPAPRVSASPATRVTASAGTLNGTFVSPATTSSYHFEYGLSRTYGRSTGVVIVGPSGGSGRPVSVRISGFRPGTVVHYRLVVSSVGGVVTSHDATFRTKSPAISHLRISPAGFRAAGKRSRSGGARVSYQDALASRTTFRVFRLVHGHRRLVQTFKHRDHAGANHFHFTGRANGKKLTPGNFVLVATPEFAEVLGRRASVTFTIKR